MIQFYMSNYFTVFHYFRTVLLSNRWSNYSLSLIFPVLTNINPHLVLHFFHHERHWISRSVFQNFSSLNNGMRRWPGSSQFPTIHQENFIACWAQNLLEYTVICTKIWKTFLYFYSVKHWQLHFSKSYKQRYKVMWI